jgi:hypothetical protein
MGFTNNEDSEGDRMPPLTATIKDAGVNYREYDNGNEESRLVVLLDPDSDVFGVQTVILSNNHILKVNPNARNIRVGGPERGFDLEIIGSVIKSGKLGYKAALWMAKLKALGVKTPEDTGDLSEIIGIKAVFKQLTYNEVKGRPKRDDEKVFWVPVELVLTPDPINGDSETEKPAEDQKVYPPIIFPTLEEDILANVDGKTEAEIVEWFEQSSHYDGKTVVPLFVALGALTGKVITENAGVYKRGISEPIAQKEVKHEADDLGPGEAGDAALTSIGVNI